MKMPDTVKLCNGPVFLDPAVEWVDSNWSESKPFPKVTRDFLSETLVLKIMILMKQEEIDRKEMCHRIGDSTYYAMEDMSKVFLRAFSRAYTRTYGNS